MTGVTETQVENINAEEEPVHNFATVGAVYSDGVTLLFDGEESPSEKHYKCNVGATIQAGDRVRILKDSGTYVIEYVVGAPNSRIKPANAVRADSAATATSATTAVSADSATRANQIINQNYPTLNIYDLYLRATSATVFQIRYGTSGSWRTITTT